MATTLLAALPGAGGGEVVQPAGKDQRQDGEDEMRMFDP
jgi:hypothetical protein